jgi:hypothetical protein
VNAIKNAISSNLQDTVSKEKRFTINPNPFSTQTTIQSDILLQNARLRIYNSFGQLLNEIKDISGYTITLNKGNLSAGIYSVRLIQSNKHIETRKIMIVD